MQTPDAPGNANGNSAALVWLRRDLRVEDNAALAAAMARHHMVHVAFVFDRTILEGLPRRDRRVAFIHASVMALDADIRARSQVPAAGVITAHADPVEWIPSLAGALGVRQVYASHDDEPDSLARDARVRTRLAAVGVAFQTCKDHVIFERDEVLTLSRSPFSVFTPYKNAWLRRANTSDFAAHDSTGSPMAFAARPPPWNRPMPDLADIGFSDDALDGSPIQPGAGGARAGFAAFESRMEHYATTRDHPALRGPSYLGMHLRFGTISIRHVAGVAWRRAQAGDQGAATWLSELIWRDFYAQILHHHSHVVGQAFKPAYDGIDWETGAAADAAFEAWCEGCTGYPLVDAGMRQLVRTGYMHNRLRMLTASFLVKDLGIDWRRGEAFFARHLNDFDLASNNGGWQWAASTGCDAQPWFRIFNPVTQSEKFDAQGTFIRRYVPELATLAVPMLHAPWLAQPLMLESAGVRLGADYPRPIVDHDSARRKTLDRYAVVRKESDPKDIKIDS